MGKRGPKKTPLETLERRGSTLVAGRVEHFAQVVHGPISTVPVIQGVPTAEEVLPRLAEAIQMQGMASPAHDLMVWELANLIVDVAKSRQAWRSIDPAISAYEYTVCASVYNQNRDRMIKMAREFGLTPASLMDIPKAALKPAEVEGESAAPLERSL